MTTIHTEFEIVGKLQRTFAILFFVFATGLSYSQNASISVEQKSIEFNNGREIFWICKGKPIISFNDSLEYYWFNEYSGVQKTKGGAGGKLLHGKYQLFNAKGGLVSESNYYLGLEHGQMRTWDEEGKIKETLKFKNGICIYMKFPSEGYIVEIVGELLKKGSIKTVYNSVGQITEKSIYVQNFRYKQTLYFEGTKTIKQECTRGMAEFFYDSYKTYYENGKPKVTGQFVDTIRNGTWTYYYEDGSIEAIENLTIYIEKYPNGTTKVRGGQLAIRNGQFIKDGYWLYYLENGTLDKVETYKGGELVKGK